MLYCTEKQEKRKAIFRSGSIPHFPVRRVPCLDELYCSLYSTVHYASCTLRAVLRIEYRTVVHHQYAVVLYSSTENAAQIIESGQPPWRIADNSQSGM